MTFKDIVETLLELTSQVLTLFIALVVLLFLWNIYKYIESPKNEKGNSFSSFERITWSVVALAVLFSVFAIVSVIKEVLGVS